MATFNVWFLVDFCVMAQVQHKSFNVCQNLPFCPTRGILYVDGLAFIIIIDEHVRQSFNNAVFL